jgi:predicted nuclease with TOPRIM domain
MNKQKLIKLRCKAWGITEDEYYCNQCSDFSLEDMARAYRRGKNKGARDKAIQNVGFYQKQMQDIYDKKNKQIADLEKENAELKEKLNFSTQYYQGEKAKEQLTKAKELIKNIIRVTWSEGWNYSPDWKVKAERFLSEVEK